MGLGTAFFKCKCSASEMIDLDHRSYSQALVYNELPLCREQTQDWEPWEITRNNTGVCSPMFKNQVSHGGELMKSIGTIHIFL